MAGICNVCIPAEAAAPPGGDPAGREGPVGGTDGELAGRVGFGGSGAVVGAAAGAAADGGGRGGVLAAACTVGCAMSPSSPGMLLKSDEPEFIL